MSIKILTIGLTALAFWPVLQWYVFRLFDKSDESLGILSLVTAILLVFIGHRAGLSKRSESNGSYLFVPLILVAIYAFIFHNAPNLVLAVIMTIALWCAMSNNETKHRLQWRGDIASPAILGLLLLSLPIIASCNFYLAYPLRLAVAWSVAFIFKLYGMSAEIIGTSICLNNQQINIDLPCSGIHFLWFASYLSLIMAFFSKANLTKTMSIVLFGGLAALIANVFRAVLISLISVNGFSSLAQNTIVHQGIGAIMFCLVAFLILKFYRSYQNKSEGKLLAVPDTNRISAGKMSTDRELATVNINGTSIRYVNLCYFLICFVAAGVPFASGKQIADFQSTQLSPVFDQLLQTYDKNPLFKKVALSEQERQFQVNFPGKIDKYGDGQTQLILRRVYLPTRQLHPIIDCLRGEGYRLISESISKDSDNIYWNELLVEINGHRFLVNERILDETGSSWVHVSDWYWASLLGQTKGPWLSITKIKAVEEVISYIN